MLAMTDAIPQLWNAVIHNYKWLVPIEETRDFKYAVLTLPVRQNTDVYIRERFLRGCKRHFGVKTLHVQWHGSGVSVYTPNMGAFLDGLRWLQKHPWVSEVVRLHHAYTVLRMTKQAADKVLVGKFGTCLHVLRTGAKVPITVNLYDNRWALIDTDALIQTLVDSQQNTKIKDDI
jgi:hypothetical protein